MEEDTFALAEEPEFEQIDPPTNTQRRRLAPAPPDARWDPTALPSDNEDGDEDDEPRWTELQLAAREGNPVRVNEILARYNLDAAERLRVVNAPPEGWYSQTALQAACMREHEEVVRILLDAGADIGAPGGNNIYMNAFELACGTGNIRLVRQLLDAGATKYVNPTRVTRYQGRTPIQAAAEAGSIPLVNMLLSLGADINAPASPSAGRTALQAACFQGHAEMVQHLLAHGADVNAPAAKHGGFTALQAACRVGEAGIVEMLLLLLSARSSSDDDGGVIVDVNAPGDVRCGGSALHAAAEAGHVGIVRRLLAAGADCNLLAGRAGMRGQTAVQSAFVLGHMDVVEVLVDAGAVGSLKGGRRLYEHVTARSWSRDEMGVDGGDGDERGRLSSMISRQRAPSPNPIARRTGYHKAEYSKLGKKDK